MSDKDKRDAAGWRLLPHPITERDYLDASDYTAVRMRDHREEYGLSTEGLPWGEEIRRARAFSTRAARW